MKQPPRSALLLVFPLSSCQASDTSRASQLLISSWFPLIFPFPQGPKCHLQGKTRPWDPWPHSRVCLKKYQQFSKRIKWSPNRNFGKKPKVSPPLVWAEGASYRNQNFPGFPRDDSFGQRTIWGFFSLFMHNLSLLCQILLEKCVQIIETYLCPRIMVRHMDNIGPPNGSSQKIKRKKKKEGEKKENLEGKGRKWRIFLILSLCVWWMSWGWFLSLYYWVKIKNNSNA